MLLIGQGTYYYILEMFWISWMRQGSLIIKHPVLFVCFECHHMTHAAYLIFMNLTDVCTDSWSSRLELKLNVTWSQLPNCRNITQPQPLSSLPPSPVFSLFWFLLLAARPEDIMVKTVAQRLHGDRNSGCVWGSLVRRGVLLRIYQELPQWKRADILIKKAFRGTWESKAARGQAGAAGPEAEVWLSIELYPRVFF